MCYNGKFTDYHQEGITISQTPHFNQMTSAEKIIRADQRKGLIVSLKTENATQREVNSQHLHDFKALYALKNASSLTATFFETGPCNCN